ncbi:uncharacterized protein LOC131851460 [Achroia grisella]|uniref:uncharacterized protein LOC131851460 n=1 Tax=Achroia grisella TaxID=688607 RepID=UPI0027D22B68|nr:uncharacterized protein LOC131851460 [Achroia grisella]
MQKFSSMDASLQRIMTAFKQFEKKLDKLQEDVNNHGQTLSELRFMVTSLSSGGDIKLDDFRRPTKNSTAMQYERLNIEQPMKRRTAIQPFSTKIKVKSFQSQKYGLRSSSLDTSFLNKVPTDKKGLGSHTYRPGKGDAPRKATMLRTRKGMDKKRSKV